MMNDYQTARELLTDAASLLMKISRPCGPNKSDMQSAIEILEIAKKLGTDECLSLQLHAVDGALGWNGTGKGRIETIQTLMGTNDDTGNEERN